MRVLRTGTWSAGIRESKLSTGRPAFPQELSVLNSSASCKTCTPKPQQPQHPQPETDLKKVHTKKVRNTFIHVAAEAGAESDRLALSCPLVELKA